MALGKYLAEFQPGFFGRTAVGTCTDFRESSLAGLQFLNCSTVCCSYPVWCWAGRCASVVRNLHSTSRSHSRIRPRGWVGNTSRDLDYAFRATSSTARQETADRSSRGDCGYVDSESLSAWAGQIRERRENALEGRQLERRYRAAVFIAGLCGILAPMLNYSFAFGQDIAPRSGARRQFWSSGCIRYLADRAGRGLLPNVTYSLYLLRKNRTGGLFQFGLPDMALAILMAALWMGAFALYGMSTSYLGRFGTPIG